ncbi:hypothetical protein WR25_16084 [Diploscapter pachys]|uniref:carbamoyl-phosphate synthase (glutamine-hydrolyzing) n=1 Tax=Diploscapter pachys TaxID=2018661 RepID=A0A2A2K430_9BILA|nr:hypothetical protein WR25_16084 [Diploscapter pachys]
MIVRQDVTEPSNFRAVERLDGWMKRHARIGLSGIDTRALTRRIRAGGAPNGVVAHSASGEFDLDALLEMARAWPGLEGMDLAKTVSTETHYAWGEAREGDVWRLGFGYGAAGEGERPHVVAIDYGSKHNIFRNLVKAGAKVTVLPAQATFDDVMAQNPDGIFLSNGPGDPAATGEYAVPVIRQLLDTGKPLFESLPANVRETHVSLFDGSNAGLELTDRPAFSVQYHPEASPGPQDSLYLFEKFVGSLNL